MSQSSGELIGAGAAHLGPASPGAASLDAVAVSADLGVAELEVARSEVANLDAANLIATYDTNAEWIRFADAKAGAVLTVNGILASFFIPTLDDLLARHEVDAPHLLASALFGGWAIAAVLSSVFAFLCIVPFRPKGRHPTIGRSPHFHSASTAKEFALDDQEAFLRSYEQLGPAGFRREVLVALLVDAHVAEAKYRHVRTAVQLLAVVAATGFAYLAVLQLVR